MTGAIMTAQVLVERLRNEITRLMAVKALADVARSPLRLPLDTVLAPALPELTSFLRKANRQLRQASLSALQVRAVSLAIAQRRRRVFNDADRAGLKAREQRACNTVACLQLASADSCSMRPTCTLGHCALTNTTKVIVHDRRVHESNLTHPGVGGFL